MSSGGRQLRSAGGAGGAVPPPSGGGVTSAAAKRGRVAKKSPAAAAEAKRARSAAEGAAAAAAAPEFYTDYEHADLLVPLASTPPAGAPTGTPLATAGVTASGMGLRASTNLSPLALGPGRNLEVDLTAADAAAVAPLLQLAPMAPAPVAAVVRRPSAQRAPVSFCVSRQSLGPRSRRWWGARALHLPTTAFCLPPMAATGSAADPARGSRVIFSACQAPYRAPGAFGEGRGRGVCCPLWHTHPFPPAPA
jgi:hypothetical protein